MKKGDLIKDAPFVPDKPIIQVNEIQVSYKPNKRNSSFKVGHSKDAYNVFLHLFCKDTIELIEQAIVLYLSRTNRIIGAYKLSSGGIQNTVVDIRMIYGVALKCAASSVVVAHNHPSGDLKPSILDIELTRKIKEAGDYLGIVLLDHMILSAEDYYSMADNGHI